MGVARRKRTLCASVRNFFQVLNFATHESKPWLTFAASTEPACTRGPSFPTQRPPPTAKTTPTPLASSALIVSVARRLVPFR